MKKKIKLEAFFSLALLFDLNIFYIWNNKFYEFNCNAESKIYLIKNNNNNIVIEEIIVIIIERIIIRLKI